jgi:hypothetical protein
VGMSSGAVRESRDRERHGRDRERERDFGAGGRSDDDARSIRIIIPQ